MNMYSVFYLSPVCDFRYSSLWKGALVLYSGKYGKLEKIGE